MERLYQSIYFIFLYLAVLLVVELRVVSSAQTIDLIVASGENVTFVCSTGGTPLDWWYYPRHINVTVIATKAKHKARVTGSNSTLTRCAVIHIEGATNEHTGLYSCGSNKINTCTYRLIVLTGGLQCGVFLQQPSFNRSLGDGFNHRKSGNKTNLVNFLCIIMHNGRVFSEISWSRSDNERINGKTTHLKLDSKTAVSKLTVNVTSESHTLYIASVRLSLDEFTASSPNIPTIHWTSPPIYNTRNEFCSGNTYTSSAPVTCPPTVAVQTTTTTTTTPVSSDVISTKVNDHVTTAAPSGDSAPSSEQRSKEINQSTISADIRTLIIALVSIIAILLTIIVLAITWFLCKKSSTRNNYPTNNSDILSIAQSYGLELSPMPSAYIRPPNDCTPFATPTMNPKSRNRHYEEIPNGDQLTEANICTRRGSADQIGTTQSPPDTAPRTISARATCPPHIDEDNLSPGYLHTLRYTCQNPNSKAGKIEKQNFPVSVRPGAATIPKQMF